MKLGAFSVSLVVKDLAASKAFYEKLGFQSVMGEPTQNWLILRNADDLTIGLFQGMFERNMLTFNPGWSPRCEPLESFADVRELQASLREQGLEVGPAIESASGPAFFMLSDPDGNPILIDQHR